MINHKHKAIATKIPKTGSTTLKSALLSVDDAWEDHMTKTGMIIPHMRPFRAKNYFDKHGYDYDSYFKFCFVRNPWARCLSAYGWYKKRTAKYVEKYLTANNLDHVTNQYEFETYYKDYIRWMVENKQELTDRMTVGVCLRKTSFKKFLVDYRDDDRSETKAYKQKMEPQYDWTVDEDGKPVMDFVGKLENYQKDFNTVCDKLNYPQQQLPHINKSKHKHYTKAYNAETKAIVTELYAKDIEYFGYKFGE